MARQKRLDRIRRITTVLIMPPLLLAGLQACQPLPAQNDPNQPGISDADRARIIRRQESLWDVDPNGILISNKARDAQAASLQAVLPVQSQTIPGGQAANLDLDGLRLSVPVEAFPSGQRVTIRAIVLSDMTDFALAVPETRVIVDGKPVLLESTGMFRLQFSGSDGQKLEPGAPLIASMPVLAGADKARVYQLRNGNWIQRKERAMSASGLQPDLRLTQSQSDNPSNPTPSEIYNDGEYTETGGFHFPQIFDQIDASGWWNFDVPQPEYTCLTVRILNAPTNAWTQITGVEYRGNSIGESRGAQTMAFNAMRSKEAIVYTSWYDPKSDDVLLGSLYLPKTPSHVAHTKTNGSACPIVGQIRLQQYKKENLKDKTAFLKAIQWPGK
ncbi:MAG: hypothetical protein KDK39_20010 [Leptospiraceae bacterium]|nr:hypothetical protein [Leptospiraceae bacterium]